MMSCCVSSPPVTSARRCRRLDLPDVELAPELGPTLSSAVQPPVSVCARQIGRVVLCWNLVETFSVRLTRTPVGDAVGEPVAVFSSECSTYVPPGERVEVLPQCSSTFFGLPFLTSSRYTSL